MDVNIYVVTHNRLAMTKRCLSAIRSETDIPHTLTVVDNASRDGSTEYLQGLKDAGLIDNLFLCRQNLGCGVASNLAWASKEADFYVKVDNDVVVQSGWLPPLLNILSRNENLAMVGYKLLSWHGERLIEIGNDTINIANGCGGGCAAMSKKMHEKLGFWCEDYGIYGFLDVDMNFRISQAGMIAGHLPKTRAIHLDDQTGTDRYSTVKKREVNSGKGGSLRTFYLNEFLYRTGLRSLRVERKYLPRQKPGSTWSFTIDPDYRPTMTRLHLLKTHFASQEKNGEINITIEASKNRWS